MCEARLEQYTIRRTRRLFLLVGAESPLMHDSNWEGRPMHGRVWSCKISRDLEFEIALNSDLTTAWSNANK